MNIKKSYSYKFWHPADSLSRKRADGWGMSQAFSEVASMWELPGQF